MLHIVLLALIVIAALFLLMLPMHMRTGRFHWVPPKHPRETDLERAHRRLHEGFGGDASLSLPLEGEGFAEEGFEAHAPLSQESPIMEFAPDTPAPVERMDQPFHLLSDWFPAAKGSRPMGAAACYQADYEQQHSCTRNFKQETNNYKRNYPDSCTGSPQDFTMQFYDRV